VRPSYDLEREQGGAAEREQVAAVEARAHPARAGEQVHADAGHEHREHHGDGRRAAVDREVGERDERRAEAGDEGRPAGRGVLEAHGLEDEAGPEEQREHRAAGQLPAGQAAEPGGHEGRREEEPEREEEQRGDEDQGLLDDGEGAAPNDRDEDQRGDALSPGHPASAGAAGRSSGRR
jgi:hypothetical protein